MDSVPGSNVASGSAGQSRRSVCDDGWEPVTVSVLTSGHALNMELCDWNVVASGTLQEREGEDRKQKDSWKVLNVGKCQQMCEIAFFFFLLRREEVSQICWIHLHVSLGIWNRALSCECAPC